MAVHLHEIVDQLTTGATVWSEIEGEWQMGGVVVTTRGSVLPFLVVSLDRQLFRLILEPEWDERVGFDLRPTHAKREEGPRPLRALMDELGLSEGNEVPQLGDIEVYGGVPMLEGPPEGFEPDLVVFTMADTCFECFHVDHLPRRCSRCRCGG